MSPSNNTSLLARVNFPLYTVQMLTSRHVIVGGGGGSSKTGVANGFEIFELSYNGDRYVVEEMKRHETGTSVVMNCACLNTPQKTFLVAGQESHCQLYTVSAEVVSTARHTNSVSKDPCQKKEGSVRRRTSSKSNIEELPPKGSSKNKKDDGTNSTASRHIEFHIKPSDSIQTDFSGGGVGEALQRVVRLSPAGDLMVTGGADGHVRLWRFPALRPTHNITAHHDEVDDLDFSPDGAAVASVSKDGKAYVWCIKTGHKLQEVEWTPPNGTKYLYKRCRYGRVEEDPKKSRLFLITNPVSRVGRQLAYVQLWDPASCKVTRLAQVEESLSALAVRDDGRFIAVGTMFSGTVDIYIAFSLQRALRVKGAHNMFVTGLEFLPAGDNTAITVAEAAVISISVDNRVCIHNVPYRRTLPSWLVVVAIIVTLFFTFVLCSLIGL